eukprot:TRINITY_DN13426_c0_g1_i2.p1 TRINITY_DN13426_c0_g1~~TRINITY_DN13426_c0_g1_i2.p1  ORF type:complete len:568 (-),score=75.83 TRINITY_DN13426_c0_g1_i2:316-2019(-)
MAGQWQREFFLITEDPFEVDLCVFNLWLEGNSVKEAAAARYAQFDTASAVGTSSTDTFQQLKDLLRQDCAQQYEAYEFLEGALADPVHFLEFPPVQLAPAARRDFVTRYYSLDSVVVREVSRMIANLQRVCQWVERAASLANASKPGSLHWQNVDSTTSDDGSNCMVEWPQASEGASVGQVLPFLPELEALGEPLIWRYRSLAFVLLCRFDLWSKASLALPCEHVEDVASVLLAVGGLPDVSSIVEVLTYRAMVERPTLERQCTSEREDRRLPSASAARAGGPLDSMVRECLRQLDSKVLRSKHSEFKAILLQEIERQNESSPSMYPDTAPSPSVAGIPARTADWSQRFFARGPRMGRLKTTKVDPTVLALGAGISSMLSPVSFQSFFGFLADFVEKLRQLDSSEPLELFQRYYSAVEVMADKEQDSKRKTAWPDWVRAWKIFLEFYRACAACAFVTKGSPSVASPGRGTREQNGSGDLQNMWQSASSVCFREATSHSSISRTTSKEACSHRAPLAQPSPPRFSGPCGLEAASPLHVSVETPAGSPQAGHPLPKLTGVPSGGMYMSL